MRFETSVDVAAPVERVWAVLVDVERWPQWTASMTEVKLIDGPLRLGANVRIKQPRLPAVVWRVTEFTPLRSFTWQAGGGGVHTTADHRVSEVDGGARLVLSIHQTGWLSLFTKSLVERYVRMEAEGLKRASTNRA